MTEANIKIVLERFKEMFHEELQSEYWSKKITSCVCDIRRGKGREGYRLLAQDIFQRVNVKLQMQLWNGKI